MKYIPIFLFLFSQLFHSQSPEKYFKDLDIELRTLKNDSIKLKSIVERENTKGKTTKNDLYYFSSKYANLYLINSRGDDLKNIAGTYQLLKLNKEKFKCIDIYCYYILSQNFGSFSPKLSMEYIDNAINISNSTENKFLLGYLYNYKGLLFYDDKKYNESLIYFRKALNYFEAENQVLYISSMHNNIGLCYLKMKMVSKSEEENINAINILLFQKNLNDDELDFLFILKKNLGNNYFKEKRYHEAEKLYMEYRDYYKDKNLRKLNDVYGRLYKTYDSMNEKDKRNAVAQLLENIEPKLTEIEIKIKNAEFLLHHYNNIGNIEKNKFYTQKILDLNSQFQNEKQNKIMKLTDMANQNNIEIFNKKNLAEINKQKKMKELYFFIFLFILSILIFRVVYFKYQEKKRFQLAYAKKEAQEIQKKVLEEKYQLQKNKINNLNLSLNLKKETENTILEKIKKVKNSPENTEKVLKDLYLEVGNLINIDNKNLDFEIESAKENTIFKKTLSEIYPTLSEQELQFCIYFRLNFSAKEVALLSKVTDKSVRVYKSKIKSKLSLNKEENLEDFLKKI